MSTMLRWSKEQLQEHLARQRRAGGIPPEAVPVPSSASRKKAKPSPVPRALPLAPVAAPATGEPIVFTLLGEPASKANSRKLVELPKKSGGTRPASIKSDKARAYVTSALQQVPLAARQRLAGRIRMTLRIFYASERPDLDESVILDVLQDQWRGKGNDRELVQAGVYRNDRQVRERHVFHGIDRDNPRAEIEVQEIE